MAKIHFYSNNPKKIKILFFRFKLFFEKSKKFYIYILTNNGYKLLLDLNNNYANHVVR